MRQWDIGREREQPRQYSLELATAHPRRVLDARAVVGHRQGVAGEALEPNPIGQPRRQQR